MLKYGIIYIVHRDTDPEYIFKVGQSTITIEERVADLNSDTTNIGTFKPVAFFVVFDIVDMLSKYEKTHQIALQR